MIRALRAAGHQVIAIVEEAAGLDDAAVLSRAHGTDAVLLTFDRDYGELIFKKLHPHPRSLIYLRSFPASPQELTDLIVRLVDGGIAGDVDGYLIVWTREGIRKRLFPSRV
ncbi:MAG: DUF5615 family PIN-like protein [Burkholderiales bacterium]|nr:DUF5615 family PIN-like protein [Burkholderiales bacterium]